VSQDRRDRRENRVSLVPPAPLEPTATLATGTTGARVFVLSFISDGTNLYEAGRTVAMVA
jgi:hypothetical protein